MPDFVAERVLLTNDDGIDAPGLKLLEEVAQTIAREVWVVAPEHDQSGVSHALSLHDPLRHTERGLRRFGVFGTPGDCVVLALRHLMLQSPPTLILSGINRGSNLGAETVFSGTVGAAMTGMLFGFKAIALSQVYTNPNPIRWETAAAYAPDVLRRLATMEWPEDCCLNVNFPDVPPSSVKPLVFTEQGPGIIEGPDVDHRTDLRHNDYFWLSIRRGSRPNPPGSETAVIQDGGISVTPLRFERTDTDALALLRDRAR